MRVLLLLVVAAAVVCSTADAKRKRKFDGDFEFAEEVGTSTPSSTTLLTKSYCLFELARKTGACLSTSSHYLHPHTWVYYVYTSTTYTILSLPVKQVLAGVRGPTKNHLLLFGGIVLPKKVNRHGGRDFSAMHFRSSHSSRGRALTSSKTKLGFGVLDDDILLFFSQMFTQV